jgi:hypothetical protein
MADRYVFADEAGNFDFSLRHSASRYFVLTTITMNDTAQIALAALAELRAGGDAAKRVLQELALHR